ncbi:hypothetical protein AB9T88_04015 [Flavobacterium sp. LBUM151]
MAKKKINIILVIVVLALWGTVGYRAINRQFSGNEIILEKPNQLGNITLNQINKDTFQLEKINRDPFLNKEFQTVVSPIRKTYAAHSPVKKNVAPVIAKPQPNMNWPVLKYYGYLKSKDQELILLKIDSKLCKLKLNDPVNGVIVKKKYKDSIEVFFNAQTKIIRLK